MDDLSRALVDISNIRRQVASRAEFRGYGPATLAGTGLLAVAAAAIQGLGVQDPARQVARYLWVWIGIAVLAALMIAVQTYTRARRLHSGMADEMIHMAVEQFLPAVGAGALLTIVVVRAVPGAAWMLPGLWQVIYSLGVFSSCRFLPGPMKLAGGWYLLTGLVCLGLGDARAMSPWTMGVAFGLGQMLVAAVLLHDAKVGEYEA